MSNVLWLSVQKQTDVWKKKQTDINMKTVQRSECTTEYQQLLNTV